MAKGVNFIVQVNTGTAETPEWTVVGGQRNATLNRSADTIDVTTKSSNGWRENESSIKDWSIDADGLLIEDDAGYAALETVYMAGNKVQIQLQTAAKNKYSGQAIITDFPIEAPYDDSATYSVSFTGDGALTKTDGV